MKIPILSFTNIDNGVYENLEFVKPSQIPMPINEYNLDFKIMNKKTHNFKNEFLCMLYDELSNLKLFSLDDVYLKLYMKIGTNDRQLVSSRVDMTENKLYDINNYFYRLFKNPNTKTLIISIFDRELFTPNHDNFDRFEKLFGSLGDEVCYINIRKGDNILEKIKNSNIKSDFVFIYCCCIGRVINNEEVIQMSGDSNLISVNAIINVATNKDPNIPIFCILECGRERYNLDYIKSDVSITYRDITKYYLADKDCCIGVGNTKCQDLIYNKLINIDKSMSSGVFDELTREIIKTGYGYFPNSIIYGSFSQLRFKYLFTKKIK